MITWEEAKHRKQVFSSPKMSIVSLFFVCRLSLCSPPRARSRVLRAGLARFFSLFSCVEKLRGYEQSTILGTAINLTSYSFISNRSNASLLQMESSKMLLNVPLCSKKETNTRIWNFCRWQGAWYSGNVF